jgi:uncharacterized membrane protein
VRADDALTFARAFAPREDAMSTSTSVPQRPHLKKRILIPAILIVLFAALVIGAYVRGTWADTSPRNPQTPAEGAVVHLYQRKDGAPQVRGAILIDAPADRVWAVIRDYPSHPRFMPYIFSLEAHPEERNRVFLSGVAHSRLWGDWPFKMHVDHLEHADKEYVASWDGPSDVLTVNRGSWTVTAVNPQQTLVVLALDWEASGYAQFFINNLLLDRVPAMLTALRDEVNGRQAG